MCVGPTLVKSLTVGPTLVKSLAILKRNSKPALQAPNIGIFCVTLKLSQLIVRTTNQGRKGIIIIACAKNEKQAFMMVNYGLLQQHSDMGITLDTSLLKTRTCKKFPKKERV